MDFHEIYDRFAAAYDLAFGAILHHGQTMAVSAMNIKPEMKILEVGIGTGLTLSHFQKDTDITGIDLSKKMLNQAEKRIKKLGMKNVKLLEMSAEKLDFKDESFDRVFAPSVFSVINEPQKALDEMIRVCKSDGTICIVSHFAGETWPAKTTDRILDPLTQRILGYRMTTHRDVVEGHSRAKVVFQKQVFGLNFSTLYLLKKS